MLLAGPQGLQSSPRNNSCGTARIAVLTRTHKKGPSWAINSQDKDKDPHFLLAQRIWARHITLPSSRPMRQAQGLPLPPALAFPTPSLHPFLLLMPHLLLSQ